MGPYGPIFFALSLSQIPFFRVDYMMPILRFRLVLLFLIWFAPLLRAQTGLPTTGKSFTFAIPEGPDNLVPVSSTPDSSKLYLYLSTSSAGTATIWSPSGYTTTFSYPAVSSMRIELPYSMMLLHNTGKVDKGMILTTTTPVQLVYHDFFPAGGEMTQIYPDPALDTSYSIATWGLYNDPGEDNHTQFAITATADNTTVTIEPAVQPIGFPSAAPFTVTLNRGECYIVKADTTGLPLSTSLSGSVVHADKPVSVISALSCGYVPTGTEACNMLLNMEIPKKFTDTIFYTTSFGDFPGYELLFTSDVANYFVIASNGTTYQSSNGVTIVPFTNTPMQFTVTAPAHCYQLSMGSAFSGIFNGTGDPSLVTVLPQSLYLDSLEWFTPDSLEYFQGGAPFPHFVSVVYPQSAESSILLDKRPIVSLATPAPIFGTNFSSIIVQVNPGTHQLTSSEPIFAIANGAGNADSYSYNICHYLTGIKCDSIRSGLSFDTLQTKNNRPSILTCRDFDIPILLQSVATDNLNKISGSFTFDNSRFTYTGYSNGQAVLPAALSVTTTTNGQIDYTITGPIAFNGTDTLMILHFHANERSGGTAFNLQSTLYQSGGDCPPAQVFQNQTMYPTVNIIRDTSSAQFSFSIDNAQAGTITHGSLHLTQPAIETISGFTVHLTYNHDLLSLEAVKGGSLSPASSATPASTSIPQTDSYTIGCFPAIAAGQTGEVLTFDFSTYITDSTTTPVYCEVVGITNTRPCPLDILALPISEATFIEADTCGTSLLRTVTQRQPIKIVAITPNPVGNSAKISFNGPLNKGAYQLSIFNELGRRVAIRTIALPQGQTTITLDDLSSFGSGQYFFEIALYDQRYTGSFLIRN